MAAVGGTPDGGWTRPIPPLLTRSGRWIRGGHSSDDWKRAAVDEAGTIRSPFHYDFVSHALIAETAMAWDYMLCPCALEPAISEIDTKPPLDLLVKIARESVWGAFSSNLAEAQYVNILRHSHDPTHVVIHQQDRHLRSGEQADPVIDFLSELGREPDAWF